MTMKWRFGLRSKLLLLSGFLFTIPWFGYQYVWEMEKYLRYGQEQTIIGTARALATAMHERANLFNNQASFLPSVEKGKDLYSYGLSAPIQLDGLNNDWPDFANKAHFYQQNNQLYTQLPPEQLSLNFTAAVGTYGKYLYLYFSVNDNEVIYRNSNARSIVNNDHLELAFINPDGIFSRFIISNKTTGWIDAYRITDTQNDIPVPATQIQGHWRDTSQGYNVEIRIPLTEFNDHIAFAVHDVDRSLGNVVASLGSADPSSAETLGTILVPSPEIERIVKGMSYTNSSIWVVDQHHRVLAKTGDIKQASGVWNKRVNNNESVDTSDNVVFSTLMKTWHSIEKNWLKPLYEKILTQPPRNFIDQLYDSENLTGKHIESALSGDPMSQWRLSTDQQAVVLSAAYPIFIDENVKGVVIVEETTNGIRTLRNQALEKLFSSILAIMLLGALAFFLFASRISNRIRTLSNQAELAIDEHGRISGNVDTSTTNDEIGDLSRSFATAVNRLGQYNHYLENMSSRLSHELRTPIAVVRTSLETLAMQHQSLNNINDAMGENTQESENPYLTRAQRGIERLSLILTNMNEATRIEQILQNTEKTQFDIGEVINGCMQGYQLIYKDIAFTYPQIPNDKYQVIGSPEHIAQLLDKVIANAVEFCDDQKVELAFNQMTPECNITIKNNGELLPEQMSEQLFDSMVSIRQKHNNEQPHLGLGLYIARLICQFHRGSIKAVNNKLNTGVDVVITLPLVK